MRRSFVVRVLLVCVLSSVAGSSGGRIVPEAVQARPDSPALTISGGGVVGEGDDLATTVLGDPWDMSEQSDVLLWNDFPNASINNGVFSYNLPPTFWAGVPLLLPSGNQIDVGKIGVLHPIDAARYRWLSFRVKQPAGSSIRILWNLGRDVLDDAYLQDISVTTSDWQTYVIDLSTAPKGKGSWTGQVTGLHLQSNAASGSQVSIDWARLTAANPTGNIVLLSWAGQTASAKLDFYLDADTTGCDGALIHTEPSATTSGSFAWGNSANDKAYPSNLAPGMYYVCAKSGSTTAYSSGTIQINQAPLFRFTSPSYTSGPDYATDAGNPWDMSDASDVNRVANGTPSFQNGMLAVSAQPSQSDQQVYMQLPNGAPIDPGRYYYLTYKVLYDYATLYFTDAGQFSRIYWGEPTQESKLIYLFPGWQTESFDLRTLPANKGPAWSSNNWNWFRLDPIANKGHSVTFYIDDVKLTGDTQADKYTDLTWQTMDPDTSVTTATLYYDNDHSGWNGTLFATLVLTDGQRMAAASSFTEQPALSIRAADDLTYTISLPFVANNYHPPCAGACYSWNTSALPAGAYYLYACLDDGYNHQGCRYSETPLVVSH
jgi:hypothetical protein